MFSTKQKLADELRASAEAVRSQPSKAEILAEAGSSFERMRWCARWQDEARAAWYEGMRRQVLAVLESDSRAYDGMGARERKAVGARLWTSSVEAKDLVGAEQMYGRWVLTYEAQDRAERYR